MERETVKEVLRRFNQSGVRYCLVGGLALAHHATPPPDARHGDSGAAGRPAAGAAGAPRSPAASHRRRPDLSDWGDRIDVIPANLRAKRAAVLGAIEATIDDQPVKVASLRDLILLKLWTAPERPELGKRTQGDADVISLIEINRENVSADDIAYICRTLLAMAYTPEAVKNYRAQVEWLNDVLDKLGMSDRRYRLE